MRPLPLPASVAIRSSAWPADEHAGRSTRTPSGTSSSASASAASAPATSPDGEEIATSRSSSSAARAAICSAAAAIQDSIRWFYLMGTAAHVATS